MKAITIIFEDEEFKKLKRIKKQLQLNWHDFVLNAVYDKTEEILNKLKLESIKKGEWK